MRVAVEIDTPRKPLSTSALRRLSMVVSGCQLQHFPPKQALFIYCDYSWLIRLTQRARKNQKASRLNKALDVLHVLQCISDVNSDSNEKFPHENYIKFVSGKDIYFKCYWVVHYYISSKSGFEFHTQNAKIACPIYMFFDMWKNPRTIEYTFNNTHAVVFL